MTPELLIRVAIDPALALLPSSMDTLPARAMLVAIALQESKCCHRRQIRGPARGFWQFEVAGVRGVLHHPASKPHFADVLAQLAYPVTADATVPYVALEHNDTLAAVCARLLLWTDPAPLPTQHDPETGWALYLRCWRPGKPHRETWDGHYAVAWDMEA